MIECSRYTKIHNLLTNTLDFRRSLHYYGNPFGFSQHFISRRRSLSPLASIRKISDWSVKKRRWGGVTKIAAFIVWYGRGERLFFQTLPPPFYIFLLEPPSLITQLCVYPPSLHIFYGFRLYFNIKIPCKTPPPPPLHIFFSDPPLPLHNCRLDPPSLLAFSKRSPHPCILLNAIAPINLIKNNNITNSAKMSINPYAAKPFLGNCLYWPIVSRNPPRLWFPHTINSVWY